MKTNQHPIPLRWLWLGVAALGIAGLFALVLVIGRTPQLKALSFMHDLFAVALVVHVDLSVLVWFLCIGGMGWSMLASKFSLAPPYWEKGAYYTVAAGTALIALSPIDTHWTVLKSNYIPVLYNFPFLAGLGLLAAGMVVLLLPLLRVFTYFHRLNNEQLCFAFAAVTTLLALAAFGISAQLLPTDLPLEERFNTLFWAGGHILQFIFVLLMMAAWVVLTEAITQRSIRRSIVVYSCVIALIAAVISFAGFAMHPFAGGDFEFYQTRVMIELGALAPVLLGVGVVWVFVRVVIPAKAGIHVQNKSIEHMDPGLRRDDSSIAGASTRAYTSSLIASIILFAFGGVLGLMIAGQNVMIPAHYHGVIVAVTLALMGLAYAMLPRFGYQSVADTRLAFWQPILYGVGQIMHVGGLAYSGGYGVLRKTAGGFANMAPEVKIALGVMGFGGLLAIIGGLLFVVVMVRARRNVE
jgi:hypothetical protein